MKRMVAATLFVSGCVSFEVKPTAPLVDPGCAKGAPALWIDTDIAMGTYTLDPDDGTAILYAITSDTWCLKGVSTSDGMHDAELALVQLEKLTRYAQTKFEYPMRADGSALERFLSDGGGTVAYLGQPRNIVSVLEKSPNLAKHVKHIVGNGGSLPESNRTLSGYVFRDANVVFDKEAWKALMGIGSLPLTIMGFEAVSDHRVLQSHLDRFKDNSSFSTWVYKQMNRYQLIFSLFTGNELRAWDTVIIDYLESPKNYGCAKKWVELHEKAGKPNETRLLAFASKRRNSLRKVQFCLSGDKELPERLASRFTARL